MSGPPAARGAGASRNGASASGVTTQGEMVVKKLLPRKGPSGWYSHAWMSRADQSFSRQKPAMVIDETHFLACRICDGTRFAQLVAGADPNCEQAELERCDEVEDLVADRDAAAGSAFRR